MTVLIIHVLIALASLGQTGFAFISPSLAKLNIAYALVLGTLSSGSYLVWSTKAPLAQACVTGLVYLGIVLLGIIATRYKLVRIRNGE